jgi:hypothetical protein
MQAALQQGQKCVKMFTFNVSAADAIVCRSFGIMMFEVFTRQVCRQLNQPGLNLPDGSTPG